MLPCVREGFSSSAPNPQTDVDQLEGAADQAIAACGGDTPKGWTGAGATLDCEMPRLCTQRGRGKQKMNSNQNSLPDLIEVLMRVVNSNEEDHRDVRVELRVNSVSLVADDCLEFVVELDRANLSLDLDGFEVVPKSRYGEPSKSNDVAIERKLTNETVLQGEVSASLEGTVSSVPSGSFSGKVSGSAGTRSTESTSAQQTQNLLRVKARGNLRWEISEPTLQGSTAALADSYLVDDVLCKIKALPGANMLAVKLAAFASKRDIRVTPRSKLSRFSFKSRNHEAMLNAVIAKALSHSESNGGILTFSIAEVFVEGD
jgi:hypothetical protein